MSYGDSAYGGGPYAGELPSVSSGEPASYLSEILADTPLAYYRLGESSGTTMLDSSGNARHGGYSGGVTLGTTGLLTGDSDTAATFSSGSGNVTYAAWMDSAAITVTAIVKPTTVSGTRTIVSRHDFPGSPFILRLEGSTLVYYTKIGGFVSFSSPTALVAGTRYHVAVTHGAGTATMYVDGVQVATASMGTPDAVTSNLIVGNSAFGEPWDGVIDEVAIFDKVLSAARIAELHTASNTAAPTNTIVTIGRATETDIAQPITIVTSFLLSISRAIETDIARPMVPIAPLLMGISRAIETDVAQSITVGINSGVILNVGKAYEIDTAQPTSVFVFTAEPPAYNDFANALSVDYDYGGEYLTLVNSTIEVGEVVPSGHTSSVWATWSAEENATINFTVSASPAETPYTVTVYHTNWATQVVQYSVVGDLSFDVDILTGLTYWIRISSATDDLGVELSWLLDGAIEPPAEPVEYLRCEVYESDGTTLITEVASRFGVSGQEPLNIVGSGQLGIKLDDTLLDAYPGLLVFGNIVKYFLADTCIHGFRIKGRSTNYVSTDEWRGWVRTVSGPSVHHLLDDFMVQHNLPLQDRRLATRAFTWAAPAGAWYKSSDWVSTYNTNTQADPPGQENSLPQDRPKWKNPPNFPDLGAEWMWVSPDPARNEGGFAPPPMLGQRYFRKSFTLKKRTTVKLFASADEKYKVYLDGEEVLTGEGEEMGFTETQTRKLTLTEGFHTLAIRGSQFSQEKILEERELEKEKGEFKDPDDPAVDGDGDGIINEGTPQEGPAPVAPPEDTQEPDTTTVRVDDGMDAILFTMMRLNDEGKPSTVVVRSNGSWLTTYVRPVPAWKRATILRRVVNEAKHRGNTSANLLTFGFDNVRDSGGRKWLDRWNHPVDIGTSALELQGMMSEGNNFDVWVDPEDLKIHAWRRRGRDRSKNIALEAGRNLLDWSIEETEEVKNDYLVQYDGGWFRWKTKNSILRFGEREAFVTMGRSKSDSDARRTLERAARGIAAAAKKAGTGDFKRWHEGAPSGSIIAVPGARPFLDYGVGDVIMAPNENAVMKRHRVLSLTFTEDDNQLVTYDAELEEI